MVRQRDENLIAQALPVKITAERFAGDTSCWPLGGWEKKIVIQTMATESRSRCSRLASAAAKVLFPAPPGPSIPIRNGRCSRVRHDNLVVTMVRSSSIRNHLTVLPRSPLCQYHATPCLPRQGAVQR
jgi:hypothetical protein